MSKATGGAEPQTERELFFHLDGKLEKLIFSLDNLADTFKEWKTREFAKVETDLIDIIRWKNEEVGKWKALAIGTAVLTIIGLILSIANVFHK